MAATYDPETTAGKVRLLISDVGGASGTDYIFEDPEIEGFLALADGSVYGAAAEACRAMAISEVLVQKKIRFLELSTDGPAQARELNTLADRYAAKAEEEAAGDAFDIAEMNAGPFADRTLRRGF